MRSIASKVLLPLVLSAAFAGWCQQSATTVPNLIRYSGTLPQSGSATASPKLTGVTFAIYQQQEGGAPVWMETQNVTLDAGGRYSVLLGSTRAEGLPSDLFSAQEERWLGVQVQGQAEQPRVLLVSVPYAMKAAEADKLAGHSASEFVTTENLQSAVQEQLQQQAPKAASTSAVSAPSASGNNGATAAVTNPATNFVDNTTNQVVQVQQNGTGMGLSASSPSNVGVLGTTNAAAVANVVAGVEGVSSLPGSYGVFGRATSTLSTNPGIGIMGQSYSPNGIGLNGMALGTGNTIGLIGQASSTAGFAIDATETATSGNTVGMLARIYSPSGIGALILNNATSPITGALISARTNAGVQFTVGGTGNINTLGSYTGAGTISGTRLISTVATGTAPLQVASTTQVPNLNASLLGGNAASGFVQNGTTTQASANFNISGNGVLGGSLSAANAVGGGSAVTGNDTATTGSSSGVSGVTANPHGSAVIGNATATTGNPNGVLGLANSFNGFGVEGVNSADGGVGIYGHASNTAGTIGTWGILGQTDSGGGGSTGVRGKATSLTGIAHGVHGSTNSATDNSAGVAGNSTATMGQVYGVSGLANSTTNNSAGVYGYQAAATGQVFGVSGYTQSTGPNASAVTGIEGATTGVVFGVFGVINTSTDLTAGVVGLSQAGTGLNAGVAGIGSSSGGTGGYFQNQNSQAGSLLIEAVDANANQRFTVDNLGNVNVTTGTTTMVTAPLMPVNHARMTVTDTGVPATFTLNWTFAFPDTNYTVTCTPQAASSTNSFFYQFQVSAVTATSVSIDLASNLTSGTYPISVTIHCTGVHD